MIYYHVCLDKSRTALKTRERPEKIFGLRLSIFDFDSSILPQAARASPGEACSAFQALLLPPETLMTVPWM